MEWTSPFQGCGGSCGQRVNRLVEFSLRETVQSFRNQALDRSFRFVWAIPFGAVGEVQAVTIPCRREQRSAEHGLELCETTPIRYHNEPPRRLGAGCPARRCSGYPPSRTHSHRPMLQGG